MQKLLPRITRMTRMETNFRHTNGGKGISTTWAQSLIRLPLNERLLEVVYLEQVRVILNGWSDLTSPRPSPLHPMERRGRNAPSVFGNTCGWPGWGLP